jgi:hypothetical protein
MMEDDYEVELWNPVQLHSITSLQILDIFLNQTGLGKTDMFTVSDVIDRVWSRSYRRTAVRP